MSLAWKNVLIEHHFTSVKFKNFYLNDLIRTFPLFVLNHTMQILDGIFCFQFLSLQLTISDVCSGTNLQYSLNLVALPALTSKTAVEIFKFM